MLRLPLILALFLSAPCLGADFLLYRHGTRLHLLGKPDGRYETPDLRPQEGHGSHLDVTACNGTLTLAYTLDVRETPWWTYCVLTQARDGSVSVAWSHSQHGTPVVTWCFDSFAEAWKCRQVCDSFAPALQRLRQPVPDATALFDAPPATDARRREVLALVKQLASPDRACRKQATIALAGYPELDEVARSTALPCPVRARVGAIVARQRPDLTAEQWAIVAGL